MSYGSTFMQFETGKGRLSQKFASRSSRREHFTQERSKAVHYEKEFDVNLSRVDSIPDKTSVKESMLAYSRKMKSILDNRTNDNGGKGGPLFVRAKHIPKYPNKPPKKRRPMSFDELLGRDRDVPADRSQGSKQRPVSEKTKPLRDVPTDNEIHLPLLSERLKQSSKGVHVSLVSASDLYDIVDFSLKSKGTRHDSLRMLRLEKEVGDYAPSLSTPRVKRRDNTSNPYDVVIPINAYNGFERQSDKSKQPNDKNKGTTDQNTKDPMAEAGERYKELFGVEIDDQPTSKLPPINTDPFKHRPNRAKRMKLVDSGLGDIPEDNIVETPKSVTKKYRERRVTSPPARQSPNRMPETAPSLGIIDEDWENKDDVDGASVTEYVVPVSSNHSQADHNAYADDKYNLVPSVFIPPIINKSSKKLIQDDGDVRIEVTQCPPKHETMNAKLKAQKRFKKLIFLRDAPR